MEKFCRIFLSFFVCFFLFSCSDFQQDLASTTVEITPEFISKVRSAISDSDSAFYISVCMEFEDGSIRDEKIIYIAEETLANGQIIVFDNLPIDKKGTISIYVIKNNTSESESNTGFYADRLSVYEGEKDFIVKAGGQHLKIDVTTSTKYTAYFTTFTETDNGTEANSPEITFTESSIITAPLPVGTTRWSIRETSTEDYQGLIGSFGEKIDVKNELMKYREKFFEIETKNLIQVYFEATGNPMNQIKTPIVYYNVTERVFTDEAGTSNTISMYEYLACNNIDEVQESNDAAEAIFSSPYSPVSDYCFDNAGNLYFIMDGRAYKLAYDFDTNSYESAIIDNEFCSPFYSDISAQSIAYDQAQNALYLLGETDVPAEGECVLAKFSNPAGNIYKQTGYPEKLGSISLPTEGAEQNSQSWTAHNGKIYVASVHQIADEYDNFSYNLVLQEYEYVEDSSNNTWTWTSEEDYPINVNNTYPNFTTDIMYQDGSLYIIFSCYNTSWNDDNNYSTGGILEYNIESNSFGESGIKGFAPNNSKKITGSSEHDISFCAPTKKTESTSFYGPTKFVAIMPKKLVFLDQGASIDDYAYNLNDPNNNNNIPTKSRIVEYDLSAKSFSSTKITGTDLYISFGFTM